MFMNFRTPLSVSVGLAIHHDRISLIRLRQIKNEIIIESFEKVRLEAGTVLDGKIKYPERIRHAVKQLVKNTGIKQNLAAIALPSSQVINKRIRVAACLNEDEIAAEIRSNFKIYLPGIEENLCFDFVPLEKMEQEIELQLIAARAEQIETYVNLFKEANLKINIVDIDIFALARSVLQVSKNNFNQVIMILDMDAEAAQLVLLKKGRVVSVYPVVMESSDILIQQIKRGIQFFLTSEPFSIEKILLTGCLANQSKVINFLKTEIIIPVEIIDLINHASTQLISTKIPMDFSEYMTAFGVALRGLAHD